MTIPEYTFKRVNLGWNTFSKKFYRQLNEVQLTKGSELYEYIVDNPDAIVISNRPWVDELLGHINEHGDGRVRSVHEDRINMGHVVKGYQIKTNEETAAE